MPPQVDLRLLQKARRRSLPSQSSRSSVSAASSASGSRSAARKFSLERPTRMRLSELDQTRLIEVNVERMTAEYGFPASVVLKVWNECGDLAETESILATLGTKLEDLVDRARKRRSSVGVDLDVSFQIPSPRSSTPVGATRLESDNDKLEQVVAPSTSISQPRSRSTASPRRVTQSKRNSPQFTPTLVGEDDIPESSYSPPVGSRAGKFVRLSRQGRLQEALDREKRRASGGRTSLKGSGS